MDPRNIQKWTNGFNIVLNGKEIWDDGIFQVIMRMGILAENEVT